MLERLCSIEVDYANSRIERGCVDFKGGVKIIHAAFTV